MTGTLFVCVGVCVSQTNTMKADPNRIIGVPRVIEEPIYRNKYITSTVQIAHHCVTVCEHGERNIVMHVLGAQVSSSRHGRCAFQPHDAPLLREHLHRNHARRS